MAAGSTYRPLAGQLAHHIAPPSSVLHTLSLSGSGELPPLLQSHDDNEQSAERCCHHASIGTALPIHYLEPDRPPRELATLGHKGSRLTNFGGGFNRWMQHTKSCHGSRSVADAPT